MLSINHIIDKVVPFITELSSEPVEISQCLGRVIAKDIISCFSQPNSSTSDLNGYAVCYEDIKTIPCQLKFIGHLTPQNVREIKVNKGEAVFIATNLPLPQGTDTVIPEENVILNDKYIAIKDNFTKGANVNIPGIDIEKDDRLISKGTLLTTRHLCQSLAVRMSWLPVYRRPKIGVIVSPELTINDNNHNHINNALHQSISLLISASGGIAINLGTATNLSSEIDEVLSFKEEAKFAFEDLDALVVIGSTNRANDSLVWVTLEQMGANIEFEDVKIGSGEKVAVGNINNVPLIGLPSHLVSAMICGIVFLRPIIFKMLNLDLYNYGFETKTAKLTRNLDAVDRKMEYLYGYLSENDHGELMVTPYSAQDCLMLSMLTKSDCIISIDKNRELVTNSNIEIILTSHSVFRS